MHKNIQRNYRLWYVPIVMIFIGLITIGLYYLHLEDQEKLAKKAFTQGEQLALDGNYHEAMTSFEEANKLKSNFPSASLSKDFMEIALKVQSKLILAKNYKEKRQFQEAFTLINEAENNIKNYNGDVVSHLVNDIVAERTDTKINQLREKTENNPSIDQLKLLLWEAEAIKHEVAQEIAANIREKIVAHAFSNANEQLKEKQFSNAREIVDEGIKYAPDSEKLLSLKTTIEKEKTAFETALEQRIEQAMSAAEQEREINKNDAVELEDVNVEEDEENNIVVSGKIQSVATVPINSISVEYMLLNSDDEVITSNEVYVYPDTLYPDEEGKFEFTHFDEDIKKNEQLKVKIEKIKWFLD
ncbi:zinc ribbon domain-containing protein [Aquibacillus koreensis]|uniref:Zinc ribbon domain-containing protein n=1 Tax=Aquibacillus koreensis TaxID=279446 RepID=A0A9X3WL87_9BACI|nr:zinc ribbon domain-containing protein [Aquibacillus koreensis]MCT2534342.1 zinc ribbon domain-containing protein [Aquibacillus koreensis]MDC3420663.1 zinc ribbon domain-containing protein [Aquibacillus koreensis]